MRVFEVKESERERVCVKEREKERESVCARDTHTEEERESVKGEQI